MGLPPECTVEAGKTQTNLFNVSLLFGDTDDPPHFCADISAQVIKKISDRWESWAEQK
jgi:hypothetical protein